MARHWREKLDPARHTDWMTWFNPGGVPAKPPADALIPGFCYFVEVCGFRFEFVALDQLRECLEYFETTHHGSTRRPSNGVEHYWQRWFERLPAGLMAAPKRDKIVQALKNALNEFAVKET